MNALCDIAGLLAAAFSLIAFGSLHWLLELLGLELD